MTIFLKPKALVLKLAKNKKIGWLLTIATYILALILYVNLGKFLLRDIFIKENPFVVGAGEKVSYLPAEIISMKELATRAKVADFRVSKLINADGNRYQRAFEFLYPIRVNSQSEFLFAMHEEKVSFGCVEIDRDGPVILYNCK
jgi:hypothetical protein